jgi:four helix bundle protein
MKNLKTPIYLKDQLLRASSSIALNLAEGSAKFSRKDQARFYQIALGSLKESEAIMILSGNNSEETSKLYFHLYCCINKLIKNIN